MKDERTDPQFKIRMPQYVKDALQASADMNNRTLSAEIVHRLIWTLGAGNLEAVDLTPRYIKSSNSALTEVVSVPGDPEAVRRALATVRNILNELDLGQGVIREAVWKDAAGNPMEPPAGFIRKKG